VRKTCRQDSFHILAYSVTPMVDSDVMTGVVRSFPNFSAALAEIVDARVFGGIHFRTACDDGQATGTAVAEYVLHTMRSGERIGKSEKTRTDAGRGQ
jgi:hypothetical protein